MIKDGDRLGNVRYRGKGFTEKEETEDVERGGEVSMNTWPLWRWEEIEVSL